MHDLINTVTAVNSKTWCHAAGLSINLLVHANDIVLLSSSWHSLQNLLNIFKNIFYIFFPIISV